MKASRLLPLLLPLATLFTACSDEKPAAVIAPAASVRVARVERSSEGVPIRAVGVLARQNEMPLSFKIGGVVEGVFVRTGERVVAGQVLARLHTGEIDAIVSRARSGVEKARRDLARIEKLQAEKVATLENLEDARTALSVAESQVQEAEFNRRYSEIVAPEAGSILSRQVEPGETIAPGRPVVQFAGDAGGWLVRVAVPERQSGALLLGDRVSLVDEAAPETVVPSQLSRISEGSDANTRSIPMELTVASLPPGWRSGKVVVAVFSPHVPQPRPIVPASALVEGVGKAASVFWVAPGSSIVKREEVEVESLVAGRAYLAKDLPAEALLVIQGAEYLRDGATVSIVTP